MKQKPNVILFFSDQQRWDTVGCYGQKLNITPNLDKLAAEGVKFEYAFSCQPVCGPARACIQTGKYATQTGCFKNNIALPLDEKTVAHWFNEAGYETAYVGKWHLASSGDEFNFKKDPVPPERRGGYKDYWMAADVLEFTSHGYDGYVFDKDMNKVEFKGYRADCITDFALDYIKKEKNKPFFLFLSHIEPHQQNDRKRYEGPEGSKEKFKNYEVPGDLVGTEGDWRENYPDYLGCVERLDYNLGRIIEELENQGIADNTVIIYTSDHASHFRTRNKEYKRSCHENSIRIPMIVKGPGFAEGKVVKELVNLLDIPATLVACAGMETPDYMVGRPLQQIAGAEASNSTGTGWPQQVFVQISESHIGRAIRTHKWKYSVKAPEKIGGQNSGSDTYVEEFLYNLDNDPHEKNNLVKDTAFVEIRKQLSEILLRYIVESGEKEPVILPA